MGHNHAHAHASQDNIKLAFFLNLGFTLVEIVGGLLTNSVAVLSDALHDLGDSLSLGLAWFLGRYSEKDSDRRYTYGYRRFSMLGALLNSVILIGGSLFVLSETVPRLSDPESFSAPGIIALAIGGIAVNGLAAWRLRGSDSVNAQVVGWHLLEDVLGWSAVLIVGIVSLFVDWPILDPLLSILITLYVLYNVVGKLRRVAELFLQAVPGHIDLDALEARLQSVDGVHDTHHVHLWSLDGERSVFTTHLVVAEDATKDDILRIKCESREHINALELDLEHIAIEVEYDDEDCALRHPEAEQAH